MGELVKNLNKAVEQPGFHFRERGPQAQSQERRPHGYCRDANEDEMFQGRRKAGSWRVLSVLLSLEDNYSIVMVSAKHQYDPAAGYMCDFHTETPFRLPAHPTLPGCRSTSFGCPASSFKLALVISFTYGNVYVSPLFSQITPLSPLPIESKSLFFMSVPPSLPPHIGWSVPSFYIPYTCVNTQYLSSLRVLKEAGGHLQASVGWGEGSLEDAS